MSDDTPSGRGDRTLVRLAELETWRRDTDEWRLRLTGVADGNGRIGELARTVSGLREDVGNSDECRSVREEAGNVRAIKRRAWAAIAAAAVAVGGSAWGLIRSRDENVAAAARQEERLHRLERIVDHFLFSRPPPIPEPVSQP